MTLLRQAFRVAVVSAIWTLVASTAAVIVGVRDASVALVAFGAVGLFDFASDIVLVVHFRGSIRSQDTGHLEQVAIRIVAVGLCAVGATAVAYSIFHLTGEHDGTQSTASVVLAALSVSGLTALAYMKRRIALRLPSRALLADGRLTAVGAVLAAVTLVGIITTEAFGWSWADPTAALAIGAGAVALGVVTARPEGE